MYKSFRDFVSLREGATIRPAPGMPAINPDADVDREIANNPQLLKQGLQPPQQKVVDRAVMAKKQAPNVSLDAAMKAAKIQADRLQQNVGAQPGGGMR